jgi:hypothetical protein
MANYRDVQLEGIESKNYYLIKIYFFYLDSTGTQNKKLKKQLQGCSFCNLKMSG